MKRRSLGGVEVGRLTLKIPSVTETASSESRKIYAI